MKITLITCLFFPFILFSQYTLIPDPFFENALIAYGFDSIQDGKVLTSNISGIQTADFSNRGISDLTGIEDFTSLISLDCYENLLTNLDVSNCSNLEWLASYNWDFGDGNNSTITLPNNTYSNSR